MIAIGSDHGGFDLKEDIKKYLTENNYEFHDFGTLDGSAIDYPDIAQTVANAIVSGECDRGFLCCGTGIGISIAANKVKGIRAACCSERYSAKMTRLHNDANILCLGGRVIGSGTALEMVEAFLTTEFEGGRHQTRIDKITSIEK